MKKIILSMLTLASFVSCNIIDNVGGGNPPTHYAGVYQLEQRKYIGGTARFIHEFLGMC